MSGWDFPGKIVNFGCLFVFSSDLERYCERVKDLEWVQGSVEESTLEGREKKKGFLEKGNLIYGCASTVTHDMTHQ